MIRTIAIRGSSLTLPPIHITLRHGWSAERARSLSPSTRRAFRNHQRRHPAAPDRDLTRTRMHDGRWRTWIQRIARGPAATSGPREPAEPASALPAPPLSADEALQQLLERVDSWRPRARFVCARHGTEAATVKLIRRFSDDSELIVESAFGRGWHRLEPPADERTFGDPVAEELQEVLARADAGWLHFMNPRWAPFFCGTCQRVYCGACWTLEEVPNPEHPNFPALRATCPEGHASMLTE